MNRPSSPPYEPTEETPMTALTVAATGDFTRRCHVCPARMEYRDGQRVDAFCSHELGRPYTETDLAIERVEAFLSVWKDHSSTSPQVAAIYTGPKGEGQRVPLLVRDLSLLLDAAGPSGNAHADGASQPAVPVRCSRCQVLMPRSGQAYICPQCGRTVSVQDYDAVVGPRCQGCERPSPTPLCQICTTVGEEHVAATPVTGGSASSAERQPDDPAHTDGAS